MCNSSDALITCQRNAIADGVREPLRVRPGSPVDRVELVVVVARQAARRPARHHKHPIV